LDEEREFLKPLEDRGDPSRNPKICIDKKRTSRKREDKREGRRSPLKKSQNFAGEKGGVKYWSRKRSGERGGTQKMTLSGGRGPKSSQFCRKGRKPAIFG